MPTRNFVVQNGLTVGPLTIDAATGSINTSGNVNITGNLGVTQISKNDSSISINDTGGFSNVLITVDGSLKANVNPLGFDISNGNIRMNNNWLVGTGGINSTGNILGAVGSFGSINSPGFINTSGNVSGATVIAGALTSTGFINTSGNVSAAVHAGGVVGIAGNIIAGLAQFAALNSTPIGNAVASSGRFTSVGVNAAAPATAGELGFTGNIIGGLARFAALNSTPIGNTTASSGSFTSVGINAAAPATAGQLGLSGNIIAGLAQFAALNSTPIGNSAASSGSFTTIGAFANITVTSAWINGGSGINFGGNVLAGPATFTSLGIGTTPSATTGEIRATNNITAYFSDQRLKENITVIPNALDKLSQISGVTYTSNDLAATFGYTDKAEQVGVLAQELKQVLPHVVKLAPFDTEYIDGVETSRSGEHYMTVQYERIIPLLVQAIKELKAEVDQLKSKE